MTETEKYVRNCERKKSQKQFDITLGTINLDMNHNTISNQYKSSDSKISRLDFSSESEEYIWLFIHLGGGGHVV